MPEDRDDVVLPFPRQQRTPPLLDPAPSQTANGPLPPPTAGPGPMTDFERQLYVGFFRDALADIDNVNADHGWRALAMLEAARQARGITWAQILGDPRVRG